MKKHLFKITLISAIILSVLIAGFNYQRMSPSDTVTIKYPVAQKMEMDLPNLASDDSSYYNDMRMPEAVVPEFTPSETVLEVKFGIDMFISLISSLSPLIAPIIVWRYKRKEN